MSDSMSLARRAVACRGWRWMPGMRAVRAVDDLEPKRLLHGTEGPLLVWPAGFEERDEGQWVRVDDEGVVVRVDPKQGTVTVSAASEQDLELTKTREIRAYAENDVVTRERARADIQASLESEVGEHEKALQAKVTEKLEGKLGDLRQELDKISNRVTGEALKRKAASLGEVQEISEDPETGSLTIRVKI